MTNKETLITRGVPVKSSRKNLPAREQGSTLDKTRFFENLMEPNGAFLLPRPVPTSAGIIFQKPQYPFHQDLLEQPYGCAIVRPTVEDTLTLFVKSDSDNVVASGSQIGGTFGGIANPVTVAPRFIGTHGVPAISSYNFNDGRFFPKGDSYESGTEYYSDPSTTGSLLSLSVNLQPVGWHGTIGARLFAVDDSVFPPVKSYIGALVNITSPGTGIVSSTAALAGQKWGLEFTRTAITEDPGVNSLVVSITVSSGAITFGNGTESESWKTFSLWDILANVPGVDVVKRQYYNSQRTCLTGFSALLRNTTAALYKSGSIVGAQLTGGSEQLLPLDAAEFYSYVSSMNDPKVYSGQLNKGLHWFFTPEKIQDYFFNPKVYQNARPFLAVSWNAPGVGPDLSELGLCWDFRINIECLTVDISMMKFLPAMDPLGLMELYLTLVSLHNPIGENPGHKAKIKNIITSISKSPLFQDTLTRMAVAGVKMIPLAAAML